MAKFWLALKSGNKKAILTGVAVLAVAIVVVLAVVPVPGAGGQQSGTVLGQFLSVVNGDESAKKSSSGSSSRSNGVAGKPLSDSERKTKRIEKQIEDVESAQKKGRLPDDKASQIIAKLNEVKQFYDSIADLDEEVWQEESRKKQRELYDWAADNELDSSYVSL